MQTPSVLRHWLSFRIRILCVTIFIVGSLFPPYIPPSALATQDVPAASPQFLLVEDGFLMKSSSLTRQGSRRAYAEGLIHTVRFGDTLDGLAKRYGIEVNTIRWANDLDDGDGIHPSDELLILPVNGVLHTVTRGQTLSRITDLYGVGQVEVMRQNRLESDFIVAGQELIIPDAEPIVGGTTQVVAEPTQELRASEEVVKTDVVAKAIPTIGVLQMPCNNCTYTQYYHPGHYALDIQTKGGGPIFAAEDGVIVRSSIGWNGGYGNIVEIDHGNSLITLYAHNKELYVRSGQRVERGQVIAWMGNSGRVYGPTGVHVHFEVQIRGVKKNPMLYLQ